MEPTTILGIVAAVVVVAILLFFVMRSKGEDELPKEGGRAEPRPEPEAKKTEKAEAKKAEAKKPEAKKPEAEATAKAPAEAEPTEAAADEEPAEAEPAGEAAAAREEPAEEEDEASEAPADEAPAERDAPAAAEETAAEGEPKKEDVKALKKGLASTRGGFIARLAKLFGKKKEIDPELLDEMQEVLITADIGVKTSEKILEQLKERMNADQLGDEDEVWEALREEARAILSTRGRELDLSKKPSVVLVVGVNGVGKTTTIGKLASRYQDEGQKVILAAGDTFRAAAVLQLEVWGRRVGCEVVKGKEKADPASVIFDAIKKAKDEDADLVIADTAGRLHTKTNLMEELKKVVRTAEKALERPVDEVLLVLDSTTGQNAIQQAQLFKDAIPVSGIALTKLDGTAKGGVILGIVDEHDLPVHFVGIGERVEDLREFDAPTFVEALFTKPDDETMAA
ncbi:MAG TPA: signal recognition particle-docking protein FtsY [Sandaracinaceae bacterium LLY-WYZ-13_1]|nr:signal recognition particle-docking protein FtsY [Sandaracinaceae bacterium LLY-WYZ-13_1]